MSDMNAEKLPLPPESQLEPVDSATGGRQSAATPPPAVSYNRAEAFGYRMFEHGKTNNTVSAQCECQALRIELGWTGAGASITPPAADAEIARLRELVRDQDTELDDLRARVRELEIRGASLIAYVPDDVLCGELQQAAARLRALTSHAKWLRMAAEEIRDEGHAVWGNTCEQAAAAIDAALARTTP